MGDPSLFLLRTEITASNHTAIEEEVLVPRVKLQKSMEEFMRSLKDYSLEETEYIISELVKKKRERGMHAMHFHCEKNPPESTCG
jgi:hypothetical protein